ncbi:MAG: hypothetical protein GY717_18170 [Rhodobacteraceae bacterium]|nr:hypothetical protein [Paracoccaceae bacterium]
MIGSILSTAVTVTVTAVGTATLAPTQAAARIETLGDCYNAVITWCNNTMPDNASECANSEGGGLDQCDGEFGNKPQGSTIDRIKILAVPEGSNGQPTARLKLVGSPRLLMLSGEASEASSRSR